MPKGRTGNYLIWRICERFKILPPGIKNIFIDNTNWNQARLVAYETIREYEEAQGW